MQFFDPYSGLVQNSSPELYNSIANYIMLAIVLASSTREVISNNNALNKKLKASQNVRESLKKLLPFFVFLFWGTIFVAIYAAYLFIDPKIAYYAYCVSAHIAAPLTMRLHNTRLIPNLESTFMVRFFRWSYYGQCLLACITVGMIITSLSRRDLVPYLLAFQVLDCALVCITDIAVYRHITHILGSSGRTQVVLSHMASSVRWTCFSAFFGTLHFFSPQFVWISAYLLTGIQSSNHVSEMFLCTLDVNVPKVGDLSPTNQARMDALVVPSFLTETTRGESRLHD